jgi:predicted RNase H-like nuclease (RuvC/YqgF family)
MAKNGNGSYPKPDILPELREEMEEYRAEARRHRSKVRKLCAQSADGADNGEEIRRRNHKVRMLNQRARRVGAKIEAIVALRQSAEKLRPVVRCLQLRGGTIEHSAAPDGRGHSSHSRIKDGV